MAETQHVVARRLRRTCSIASCGRPIRVILYSDGTYRGGHYFGRVLPGRGVQGEYWECPRCYWGKRV